MEVKFRFSKDLQLNNEKYTLLNKLTDGDMSFLKGQLLRYATEKGALGNAIYASRQERLYYVNFCEPYLTVHRGHLNQEIKITGAEDNEVFSLIKADVTGYGKDYQRMALDMIWEYIKSGLCGVLVDRTKTPAINLADAKEKKERSYQVLYYAQDIYSYKYFDEGSRKGKLQELILADKIEEDKIYAKRYYFNQREQVVIQDIYFEGKTLPDITKEAVFKANSEGEILQIQEIPFVFFGSGAEESFLHAYYNLNLAHMNLKSVLSNVNYNQGFQRSFVLGAKAEEVKNIGEYLINLISNPDANVLTIPSGSPDAIEKEIDKLEKQMHRYGKFEFNQLADDTRQVQSSESKAKDMIARVGIYDTVINELEKALEQIYKLHFAYENITEDLTVEITREYHLEDAQEEVQLLTLAFSQAREVGAVEVQKDILKALILKLRLPMRDEDGGDRDLQLQRLFDSIDSASVATSLSSVNRPGIGSFFQ